MADLSVTLFGPIDALLAPYIEYVLLALIVLNFISRHVAHRAYKRRAENDDIEELSRHPFHLATTWALVLSTFYYLTLHHHAGIVLSVLVLATFFADFFEFEARNVDLREGRALEAPKGAIVAATFALLYIAYLSVFYLVKPYWTQVV